MVIFAVVDWERTCDSVESRDQEQQDHGQVNVQTQSLVDEDGPCKHVCLEWRWKDGWRGDKVGIRKKEIQSFI